MGGPRAERTHCRPALPDLHITQVFDGYPSGTHRVEVNPDFTLYAQTTRQGDCFVRQISDNKEIAHFPARGTLISARFGPKSTLLLNGESAQLFELWHLGSPKPALRLSLETANGFVFGPDGESLVVSNHDGSVEIFDITTGECRKRFGPNSALPTQSLAQHPSAPYLAICSYHSRFLFLRDLKSGDVIDTFALPWPKSMMCRLEPGWPHPGCIRRFEWADSAP